MASHQETTAALVLSPFTQSEVPKVYDEAHKHVRQSTAELLKTWQASFFTSGEENDASDHQYLEIGCGPGNFTRNHLLPMCPPTLKRLVSTDVSDGMLNYAKLVHGHAKIVRRKLDITDDEEVSRFIAEEGRFQRVYSFLALHWVKDKCAALKNIERLMTPGGECLVMYVPVPGPGHLLYGSLLESELWTKYHNVIRGIMPVQPEPCSPIAFRDGLINLVKQTKLVPLTCELLQINLEAASIDEAARMYTAGNALYPLLTQEEKPELFKFIRDVFQRGYSRDISTIASPQSLRLIFHGYKPQT
ncbi:juvenile hormone acid O-methyltransferase-like [Dermacentor albipictus]|uniref:juvenile hormone acid O-methyltransferase-like n=1 Tax=Dermacentor albipictus TaxID=60249 RepID=UPI0038FD285B